MDKKKILIVDDDPDLVKGLRVRLEASGYATAFATNAASAVDAALREQPDVILLDMGLPDGTGFVVMKRFEQTDSLAGIPVIFLTGRPPHVYKDPALIAGAKEFLQKPIDNSELLHAIQRALAESNA
ncbi:MAG: response regulator [Candidatus Binatia bacterium]